MLLPVDLVVKHDAQKFDGVNHLEEVRASCSGGQFGSFLLTGMPRVQSSTF